MPSKSTYQFSDVEEKVLDAIKQGQDAALSAVRDAADAVASALPKVPEWVGSVTSSLPRLPEWADLGITPSIENLMAFSEKIWDSQRRFNQQLFEAVEPIGSQALAAARETAKAATLVSDAPAAPKTTASHTAKTTASHTPKTTTPKA
ncbi:MAG TPA: hypothetical protein VHT30_05130 [Acidimicrobiales bacterium]|jgi:hypothetical protein|nr:hypothetical protein [Acidimicrobiales bacterium]